MANSYYNDDDGRPLIKEISHREIVARKARPCFCGRPILPGEMYTRHAVIIDGDWDVTVEGHHAHSGEDGDVVNVIDEDDEAAQPW